MMIQRIRGMRLVAVAALCAVLLCCAALSETLVSEVSEPVPTAGAEMSAEFEKIVIAYDVAFSDEGVPGDVVLKFSGTAGKGIMFNVKTADTQNGTIVSVYDTPEMCLLADGSYQYTLTADKVTAGQTYKVTAYYVQDEAGQAGSDFSGSVTQNMLDKNGNLSFSLIDLTDIRIDQPVQGAILNDKADKIQIDVSAHPHAKLNAVFSYGEEIIRTITGNADETGRWLVEGPEIAVLPQNTELGIEICVSYADWDPKHKKDAIITFYLDTKAPEVSINEDIDDIDRKISGICPDESKIEVRLMVQSEDTAEPVVINAVTTDKKGKFAFRSKDADWMDHIGGDIFIQAVDAAGNESERISILPMIEAYAKVELEDITPIDAAIRFADGKYNMSVTAEPKAEVKIEFIDALSDEIVYSGTTDIKKDGSISIELPLEIDAAKKNEAIIEGAKYIVRISYTDEDFALAPAFEREFTAYGKPPQIESDIADGMSAGETEISGTASESGTVTLWVKGAESEALGTADSSFIEVKSAHTVEGIDKENNVVHEFIFEGITPEVGRQYKLSFVNDWGDDRAAELIGVVVDMPVFFSSIDFVSDTISEGYAAYNKPFAITGIVLAEKEFDALKLDVNGAGFSDLLNLSVNEELDYIIDPAKIAQLVKDHPEFADKGEFEAAGVFTKELNIKNYAIGDYNVKIRMISAGESGENVDANGVLVPDIVNGDVGTMFRVDKDPKDMGKYTFVLALFGLGFVACLAIMIITGRKVKFLKRAALNASNESNLTTRYKSTL